MAASAVVDHLPVHELQAPVSPTDASGRLPRWPNSWGLARVGGVGPDRGGGGDGVQPFPAHYSSATKSDRRILRRGEVDGERTPAIASAATDSVS